MFSRSLVPYASPKTIRTNPLFQLLKIPFIIKWVIVYIAFWIAEEIILRVVISWIFGPKNEPAEPVIPAITP